MVDITYFVVLGSVLPEEMIYRERVVISSTISFPLLHPSGFCFLLVQKGACGGDKQQCAVEITEHVM